MDKSSAIIAKIEIKIAGIDALAILQLNNKWIEFLDSFMQSSIIICF